MPDDKLALALQSRLQRFAKPWYQLRALRIFRDKTGLGVTPALWSAIEKALEESEYFLLLASPHAARSEWVAKEVKHWLYHQSIDRLLIIWSDGKVKWEKNDFDWAVHEGFVNRDLFPPARPRVDLNRDLVTC